jgi:hypothetical protein
MPARSIAPISIAALVLTHTPVARAQDSMACDAKRLCSPSTCVDGDSMIHDYLRGEVQGMMSWHSDVFRKDIAGPINTQSYRYYRAIRVDNPKVLPLFWRSAGLKYLGSKAGDEKGCVVACTQSEWDDKGPSRHPIQASHQGRY